MTHQRDIITVNLSNPKHNVTRRQQQAALRALKRKHRPAVILVQEAVPGLKAPIGYVKYGAKKGGITEIPIFVKKGIDVVGDGSHKAVDGVGGSWPDRGFTWVRLGDGLVVFCTHPNSHIDYAGRPLPGKAWEVTREEHFPDLDAAIALHAKNGRAVVGGDFNIDAVADRKNRVRAFPSARFNRLGLGEVIYRGHTLGGRSVDRIFYERSQLRPVSAKVLPKIHPRFDHHPVWVRLAFK